MTETAGLGTDATQATAPSAGVKVPFFGSRKRARELAGEVERLREAQDRLGILSAIELERRREELAAQIAAAEAESARQRADAAAALDRDVAKARDEKSRLESEVAELRQRIIVTEEAEILQEVGVYEYRHPLTDAVAYQGELKRLSEQIKLIARKDGGAVLATTNWTVNNSRSKGRAMVRDFSKLMLRAYNAEADNLVRGLKPYKLDSAIDRLTKVTVTIAKLGKTMDIRISDAYHALRIRELELTADYLEKVAEEKEREREERERLREERKAQQEIERERARLEKERQHYLNALAALEANGDEEGIARLRDQLAEVDRAIEDVDYRAANIRAGYVYVISNVGSFGPDVVKIGMTRRLEPLDRVRELGDASVPFRFDVHALFFSEDAVGIESSLHARFAEQRINRVNMRREFFRSSPQEVRAALLELAGELLQFEEVPEALEFRQSVHGQTATPAGPQPAA
jgi:hypothetical protein